MDENEVFSNADEDVNLFNTPTDGCSEEDDCSIITESDGSEIERSVEADGENNCSSTIDGEDIPNVSINSSDEEIERSAAVDSDDVEFTRDADTEKDGESSSLGGDKGV